jgi:hypothetical protein
MTGPLWKESGGTEADRADEAKRLLEIDGRVTADINQFPEDLRVRQFPEVHS